MENLKTAVWIAHSLFERGKASGSSANMSFKGWRMDFRAKAQQRISAAPNDV